MFCRNCGNEITEESRFCGKCGCEVNNVEIIKNEDCIQSEKVEVETAIEKPCEESADEGKQEVIESLENQEETPAEEVGENIEAVSAKNEITEKLGEIFTIVQNEAKGKTKVAKEAIDNTKNKLPKYEESLKSVNIKSFISNKKYIAFILVVLVAVTALLVLNNPKEIYGEWQVAPKSLDAKLSNYPEEDFKIFEDGSFTCDGYGGSYYINDDRITLRILWESHAYKFQLKGDTLILRNVEDDQSIYYNRVK